MIAPMRAIKAAGRKPSGKDNPPTPQPAPLHNSAKSSHHQQPLAGNSIHHRVVFDSMDGLIFIMEFR
jgi:hypothetical protein